MTTKQTTFPESVWNLGCSADGPISRLHRLTTPIFLSCIAIFQVLAIFFGTPIKCWCPMEFNSNLVTYSEAHCWKEGRHYIPNGSMDSPEEISMIGVPVIYSWIPVGILFMALSSLFPWLIWQELTSLMPINLTSFIASGQKLQQGATGTEREKISERLASQIHLHISPMFSIYFTFCQVMLKLLSLASVVIQFFCLNWLLGISFQSFGINWAERIFNSGTIFQESEFFPDLTLCDLQVRRLIGNMHRFTFQCEFAIRPLMEKTLLIIWTHFVVLTVITTWSLLRDVITMVIPASHYNIAQQLLPNQSVEAFTGTYLKADGLYLLRVLEREAGGIAAAETAEALYRMFSRTSLEVPQGFPRNIEEGNQIRLGQVKATKASAPVLYPTENLQPL